MSREEAKDAPRMSSNNSDNLIAFVLCSLLCVLSYTKWARTQKINKYNFVL